MDYKEKQVVWISADVHKELKEYCKEHGLKMVYVVEQLIKKKLDIK
jgi:peroxiredoxin